MTDLARRQTAVLFSTLLIAPMLATLGGCATSASQTATAPAATPAVEWNAPAEELKPLAFLAGGWAMKQPRNSMIEEHWTLPRGNAMVAMFRRVRGDQINAFFEFTQIIVEPTADKAAKQVLLRQRHIHGRFEVDQRRAEAMVLKLESADGKVATFLPVENAGTLAKITYTLEDPNTLVLKVEAKDPAKEPTLEFRMTRIRAGT